MAMLYATPQEYLAHSRPVDPQVDMKNMLAALGGAYQAPSTSYFGMSPSEVAQSASQVGGVISKMANQLQAAQQLGVQQERQKFQDANAAHQLYLADRDQRQQEALRALQMAHMQQSMAQSAASHKLALQEAQDRIAANKLLAGMTVEVNGKQVPAHLIKYVHPSMLKGNNLTKYEQERADNINNWAGVGVTDASRLPNMIKFIEDGLTAWKKHASDVVNQADTTPEARENFLINYAKDWGVGEDSARKVFNLSQVQASQEGQPVASQPTALDPTLWDRVVEAFKTGWTPNSSKRK